MEFRVHKPPKSAMAYYVKLFCKKKSSKGPSDVQMALKSWHSLSATEQQTFCDKFNKCQQDFEKRYGVYLKSVEPFMKKKPSSGKKTIEDTSTCETKVANQGTEFQNSDDIDSIELSFPDQVRAASVVDTSGQMIEAEDNQALQILPEPTPPCVRTGKELYEAVNVIEEKPIEWKQLSKQERAKYNSAVRSIKGEYIKKYHNYLENLPADLLFQHYIKALKN